MAKRAAAILGTIVIALAIANPLAAGDGEDFDQADHRDDGLALQLPDFDLKAEDYRPLNLCDIADATEAGLDIGDLDAEWASLGIDCSTREVRLTRAQVAVDSLITEGDPTASELAELLALDRVVAAKIDRHLGLKNTSQYKSNLRTNARKADAIAVVENSVTIDAEGRVRGLVRNESDFSFKNVIVRLRRGNSASARLGLELQPGELLPFEFESNRTELPNANEFRITAANSNEKERGLRSVRVSVTGEAEYDVEILPNTFSDLGKRTPEGLALVTTANLVVEQPSNGQVVRRIRNPVAHIAFIDVDGRVVEVEELTVAEIESSGRLRKASVIAVGNPLSGIVGFIEPENAASFIIWAGGRVK